MNMSIREVELIVHTLEEEKKERDRRAKEEEIKRQEKEQSLKIQKQQDQAKRRMKK